MEEAEHERWKQVEELDYEVSSLGRVRRRSHPDHVLKPQTYVHVTLVVRGKTVRKAVHRLVAEAFLGAPPSDSQADVNHKDGVHSNNRADNLEWVDARENQLHAIKLGLYGGRGEVHGRAKLTEEDVHEIRRRYTGVYGDQTKLAREFGVSQALVAKIVRGDLWTHLSDCPEVAPVIAKGHEHGAKLTEDQVREIRSRYSGKYGEQTALAREYGVPVSVVRHVVWGKSWKQLTGTRFYVVAHGARHGHAKLTDGKVRWMRRLHFERGCTVIEIAKRYGITRPIARDVIYGKTWKHVK